MQWQCKLGLATVARVWQVDITSPGSESSAHELYDDVLDTVADPLNDTSCSRCAHLCQHPRGNALQPSKQSLWTLLFHLLWLLALAVALAGHAGLFLQTPAQASLGCAYSCLHNERDTLLIWAPTIPPQVTALRARAVAKGKTAAGKRVRKLWV